MKGTLKSWLRVYSWKTSNFHALVTKWMIHTLLPWTFDPPPLFFFFSLSLSLSLSHVRWDCNRVTNKLAKNSKKFCCHLWFGLRTFIRTFLPLLLTTDYICWFNYGFETRTGPYGPTEKTSNRSFLRFF